MSHKAVNWALEQRHLKPGPWIVLIQLGDRHNKDTKQVNPEQATLAADCNMSRATVNRHLDELEGLGLVQRIPRQHPVTKKRLSTFYILGLDFAAPPKIDHAMSQVETRKEGARNENITQSHVSNCDTETVSQKTQKPCLKNRDSRVSNCDTNHVREPVKEPCAAGAAHTGFDFEDFADRFRSAYPRPGDGEATNAELRAAIEGGVDPELILRGAKAYALEQKGNRRQYIAYPENWLRRRGWETQADAGPEANAEDVDAFYAKTIKEGKPWLCTHISADRARGLVSAGLVTVEECQKVGAL
ncbi:helix-turn-helix domain-containing protein [Roseovarius pacificus]|uniref:helix-turn-helix domain-containing protein n=1 Tax=Roseovarius pacificus TaxID=337701 RepID=UPI002A18CC8B|nr:helix-turn-helix domain-containing protein [Roseovarius pacificus]